MSANDPRKIGKWEEPFSIENVACHATLLPNGKILCWSRRSNPMSPTADMNEQRTNAFLIDVKAKGGAKCEYTSNQPQSLGYVPKDAKDSRESNINIFCSGHCLLPDGNLFVVGGHVKDVEGLQQACVYDWQKNTWSAKPTPRVGRWYPSALALPDSSVLTISGFTAEHHLDQIPQIWREKGWDVKLVQSPPNALDDDNAMSSILPMYPRLHLDPFGQSLFLDLNTATSNLTGQWGPIKNELKGEEFIREFGAAVTYDVGKVLWTGGGNGRDVIKVTEGGGKQAFGAPTNSTEIIDLTVKEPKWKTSPSMNMKYSRRQHNLTTLPDGTVLVTGGTRGQGFNDLTTGMPVHRAERWNPAEEKWTEMAAESTDRCYHGVALLLPDGSVFSAGGGEGGEFDAPPNPPVPNPARDNHTNAQIYKPPYFFIGDAPRITGVPKEAKYGQPFDVTVTGNDKINRISWIRLPSVTHTLNSSQSVYFQVFEEKQEKGGRFTVVPPNNRNVATPGHYMLFFVNVQGRPSEADIIKISPEKTAEERTLQKTLDAIPSSNTRLASRMATQTVQNLPEVNQEVIAKMDKPAVKVGLTPVCPYGLGPCWAGAFEGLQHIQDVDVVRPLPDQANSVAFVYLKEEKLPDLDVWRKEFSQVAGGAYDMRGIELTITGTAMKKQGSIEDALFLSSTSVQQDLSLEPFTATSKLERDHKACALITVSDNELSAYSSLYAMVGRHPDGLRINVTGRLHKRGEKESCLDVKGYEVVPDATKF